MSAVLHRLVTISLSSSRIVGACRDVNRMRRSLSILVLSKGSGGQGVLGHDNDEQDIAQFKVIETLQSGDIKRVSAGWGHSAAVTSAGNIFLFGRPYDFKSVQMSNRIKKFVPMLHSLIVRFSKYISNNRSSLESYLWLPTIMEQFSDPIKDIRCTAGFTILLTQTGIVYCFGINRWGQCGQNETKPIPCVYQPLPVRLEARAGRWTTIDAGLQHCIGSTESGEVFCWGKGNRGQIGDNNISIANPMPIKIAFPGDSSKSKTFIRSVVAGFAFSAALSDDGKAFVWGKFFSVVPKSKNDNNNSNSNNNNTTTSSPRRKVVYEDQLFPRLVSLPGNRRVKEIAASNFALVLRAEDDTLWVLGVDSMQEIYPHPIAVMAHVQRPQFCVSDDDLLFLDRDDPRSREEINAIIANNNDNSQGIRLPTSSKLMRGHDRVIVAVPTAQVHQSTLMWDILQASKRAIDGDSEDVSLLHTGARQDETVARDVLFEVALHRGHSHLRVKRGCGIEVPGINSYSIQDYSEGFMHSLITIQTHD